MYWNRLSVETSEAGLDLISSLLIDVGATGVEIEGGEPPAEEHNEYAMPFEKTDTVFVKAYYGQADYDSVLAAIKEGINSLINSSEADLGTLHLSTDKVKNDDWNENFKKHFTAFRAAGKIVIKPTWENYSVQDDDIVIEIDPGLAFGSGEHETTRMCLELLQKYIGIESYVLDVGCGSGILGIASAKLGASRVLAVDNDSVCVRVTEENSYTNRADAVTVKKSNLLDSVGDEKFNIVLANIVADVIIRLNEEISEYLDIDSVYIMSGIIDDRLSDVNSSLEKNSLKVIETLSRGDWRAVVARLA